LRELFYGKGSRRIAFGFKRILSMNIHQFGEQGKLVGYCIIIHACKLGFIPVGRF
jgi:hypothetical protein